MKKFTLAMACTLICGVACQSTTTGHERTELQNAMKRVDTVQLPALIDASTVLGGKITSIDTGMMAMSMPPIISFTFGLSDGEWLSGKEGDVKTVKYSYRGERLPFGIGDRVILWSTGDNILNQGIKSDKATEEAVEEILEHLGPGWRLDANANCVNPWNDKANRPYCAEVSNDIVLTVEQIPAANPIQYQNSYGDGKFKVTVKNTDDESEVILPLRKKDGKILWEESLVCVTGGKASVFPAPMPAGTEPVRLNPGESVSGEINTLKLKDVEWPRGGARVYFTFALGTVRTTQFFYYFSKLHDPMRDAAQKSN